MNVRQNFQASSNYEFDPVGGWNFCVTNFRTEHSTGFADLLALNFINRFNKLQLEPGTV